MSAVHSIPKRLLNNYISQSFRQVVTLGCNLLKLRFLLFYTWIQHWFGRLQDELASDSMRKEQVLFTVVSSCTMICAVDLIAPSS